jgi:hypothetical protein
MNKREGKKIAVIAAVIMGFMVIAFLPLASATVTSFTVTPSTGIAGAVNSYNALVTTDGVTTINITIPAGFIAVTPTTGGVEIARVDFWNESTKAYYGYATITSNIANPTTKVDIYCKFGDDAITTTQNVSYAAGALNAFVSGFAGDTSSAIIKLPTEIGDPAETVDGSIKITIASPAFKLDDVMIAIKQSVRNPTTAGDYDFKAEEQVATVTIKSSEGSGSTVFRNGQWFIDKTGDQKTNLYFRYGTTGDIPVVGEFGSEDYGVFRNGRWFIDTDFDQKTDLCFWYGTDGDIPVVGEFGSEDYGVFRNGRWFIDTDFDQKTNLCFWYGTDGDIPVVGNFGGDDGYGVFRNGRWFIDTTGNQKTNICFWYGTTGDKPVVGDFNGDGKDDYGVFRNGRWFIDTDFDQKTNLCYWYGTTGDKPLFTSDIG